MPFWHLCADRKGLHTGVMRLPQSSRKSLSVRIVSNCVVLLFAFSAVPQLFARSQQLVSSPANLRFGSVAVGQSETQNAILTNYGQTSVTISAITPNGAGFSIPGLTLPSVLAAGQSVSLSVKFSPSSTGRTDGGVTITSNASNTTLELGVRGSGIGNSVLSASPSSLSFGQITVGSNTTLPVVMTNTGSSTETLTALQTVGSGYSVSGASFPLVLNKGQGVTLNVTFTPKSTGVFNGSVFITGPNLNIPVTGTGATTTVGQLTVAPTSLSFGNVNLGTTTSLPMTVTATGGTVTVNSASSSNPQFSISGASFPLTLNAGQSTQLNVAFDPTASGSASATLTYSSNASNSMATESASGTGISTQYSVNLSWQSSTSTVSGYNVYRGTTAGSYSKINTALDPGTTYTDNGVVAGTTYYYAATSVNSTGQESTYSAPITVSIP